jgi:hypothetical protein
VKRIVVTPHGVLQAAKTTGTQSAMVIVTDGQPNCGSGSGNGCSTMRHQYELSPARHRGAGPPAFPSSDQDERDHVGGHERLHEA